LPSDTVKCVDKRSCRGWLEEGTGYLLQMQDLIISGALGLIAAAVVVRYANDLPIPAFNFGEGEVDGAEGMDGAVKGPVTKFPSANSFSSNSSEEQIKEEIVGVDTSDVSPEDLSPLPRGELLAQNSSAEDASGSSARGVSGGRIEKGPATASGKAVLQKKENRSPLGSREAFEKVFGITTAMKEEMKDEMKRQMKKGSLNERMETVDPGASIVKLVEWGIFIFIVCAGIFALNEYTQGDFGRVVAGLFPREVAALGLKDFLEKGKAKGGDDLVSATPPSTTTSGEL